MHIAQIDRKLFQLIKDRKQTSVNIQSRFNTSMSGYSQGYFITILNESKELLPMSLVLSGRVDSDSVLNAHRIKISNEEGAALYYDEGTTFEDLQVGKGERLSLTGSDLERLLIFLQKNTLKEGLYPLLSRSNIMKLPQRTDGHLIGSENFFLEKLDLFLSGLLSGSLDRTHNIIGFGPGLTPSSDDFLVGLLSVLVYAGDHRSRKIDQYINLHKGKTTEVSRWMLHYAANHRLFPIIVKRFYQTRGHNLEQFLTHGGTSGFDLLCGIYTGLFMILNEKGDDKWEIES